MVHTLYDSTIVIAQNLLKSLTHILQEAEKLPNANAFLAARLHEDMYPLPDQIRLATQFSENLVARLTAREAVTFEGNTSLTTFAQFHERIQLVLKTLDEANKDVVNQQTDVASPTPLGPKRTVDMSAAMYVHSIVLPNIYFHVVTAYGILRKDGVTLGKLDYYNGFLGQFTNL